MQLQTTIFCHNVKQTPALYYYSSVCAGWDWLYTFWFKDSQKLFCKCKSKTNLFLSSKRLWNPHDYTLKGLGDKPLGSMQTVSEIHSWFLSPLSGGEVNQMTAWSLKINTFEGVHYQKNQDPSTDPVFCDDSGLRQSSDYFFVFRSSTGWTVNWNAVRWRSQKVEPLWLWQCTDASERNMYEGQLGGQYPGLSVLQQHSPAECYVSASCMFYDNTLKRSLEV